MVLPLGFESEKPNQVCRLLRSLYGLKQASRQQNAKLIDAFIQVGFKQSGADPSLFTKGTNSDFITLLVYVDDIIVTSAKADLIQSFKLSWIKLSRSKTQWLSMSSANKVADGFTKPLPITQYQCFTSKLASRNFMLQLTGGY